MSGVIGAEDGALIGRVGTVGVDLLGSEVTLTSGSGWGGWTEIVASATSELLIVGFVLNLNALALSGTTATFLRIGSGGSGSEVALGATAGPGQGTTRLWYPLAFPVRVAAGARVAAGMWQNSGSQSGKFRVLAAPVASVEGA